MHKLQNKMFLKCDLGKPQKRVLFLVAGSLRGGGQNVCASKEKRTKGLSGRATKKRTFILRIPLHTNRQIK